MATTRNRQEIEKAEHRESIDAKAVSPITDYDNEVALGNIAGAKRVLVSGSNLNLGSTEELISEVSGMYQFLTTATQLNLVSTDVNDIAGGTGAQSVLLEYLDANEDEQTEVIALNGTIPVQTVANVFRINSMAVFAVGSSNEHLGSITIYDGANILGLIKPNQFRLRQAIYSVPRNKVALFRKVIIAAGKNDEVTLYFRGVIRPIHNGNQLFNVSFAYQNTIDIVNQLPASFPAGTDINVNAIKTGSAGTGRISIAFELEVRDL